ncbi:HEAT repeat protein [Thalassoglobus neptunius]|uniref:HEAT repeat protein n=1 Tax=Thalassoglobus neptunius TaxID=1938619 RepID=A0A5C5W815_9PLAN|nr:HEAT repeat domain-containing protein [Thalassoglobus neptunius]TWT47038.1 HEAT repeat protein [Thalassoglobus neptunius]
MLTVAQGSKLGSMILFAFVVITSTAWMSHSVNAQENADPESGPRRSIHFRTVPSFELRQSSIQERDVPAKLWFQALKRQERDPICRAAESFVVAHRENLPGIPEETGALLEKVFFETDDPAARKCLALAIVEFDAISDTEPYEEVVTSGEFELSQILEPELARKGSSATIERNLSRLSDPLTARPLLLLAIEVVRVGKVTEAREALQSIVLNGRARSDLRMKSAQALGEMFSTGLISDATELADRTDDVAAPLLAVRLIENHPDESTVPILLKLAKSPVPVVQATAFTLLADIDPQLVVDLSQEQFELAPSLSHPHAGVRLALIQSAYRVGDFDSVEILCEFLDDPNPKNRQLAADALFVISAENDQLRQAVVDSVLTSLQSDSWRPLEHASLLASGLEMKDVTPRMMELLKHDRPKVAASAAYALKVFQQEESLAAATEQIVENTPRIFDFRDPRNRVAFKLICEQTQHLAELVGMMKYRPADEALRAFIPKKEPGNIVITDDLTRGVAIWSLGQMHAGDPDPELIDAWIDRLNDTTSLVPEFEYIREGAVYALAWSGDPGLIPYLKVYALRDSLSRGVPTASAWGIAELGGEEIPLPAPVEGFNDRNWSLRYSEIPEVSEPSDNNTP